MDVRESRAATGLQAPRVDGILVAVDEKCDLNCKFCLRADVGRIRLTMDTYARALSRCKELGATSVCLTGGEPTDHPDFRQLVRVAVQFGYECSVVTAARAGARTDALAGAAGLLSHTTVSADTRGAQELGATQRTIASASDVFAALGHNRASLHVTAWEVTQQDVADIVSVATEFDIEVEISPLVLSRHQLRRTSTAEVRAQYRRDIELIGARVGLTGRFHSALADLEANLAGVRRPACVSTRAYVSPRGMLRLCPYDREREVSVLAPRDRIQEALTAMKQSPVAVGPTCALVCREEGQCHT